jgi:hypothetical protein
MPQNILHALKIHGRAMLSLMLKKFMIPKAAWVLHSRASMLLIHKIVVFTLLKFSSSHKVSS